MFLIDLKGSESIYEQIKKQIVRFIDIGVLKANDKLPSVRMLANDLGINPNTVERAYNELEKEGIIYTISKKGAFVSSKDNENFVITQAKIALESLKKDGLTRKEAIDIVNELYKEDK